MTHTLAFRHLLAISLLAAAATACDGGDSGATDALADLGDTSDSGSDALPDSAPEIPPHVAAWCDSALAQVYDPAAGTQFDAFPDDFFTVDAATPTGLRVTVDSETAPWTDGLDTAVAAIYRDLSELDGWGISAGIYLRFTAPPGEFPSGPQTAIDGPVALWDLGDDTAHRVPFESQLTDGGKTVIVWPMVPLRPATRHAFVVSSDFATTGGGCIAPSPVLRSVLDGSATDPALARLAARYSELFDKASLFPDQVSAATVFTTQAAFDLPIAVATDIRTRAIDWNQQPKCSASSPIRVCNGSFTGLDYRSDARHNSREPVDTWTIPVNVYLPAGAADPVPVVIFGHGLGGDRFQAQFAAQALQALGVAVVAIDAPFHGNHPTKPPGNDPLVIFKLLGVDVSGPSFDGPLLHTNFRQAAFDKLQLLRLLETHKDIDGDGRSDLDLGRVSYFGVSLGGIMGPQLLATHDGIDSAVLSVAGGRLVQIITDSQQFGIFLNIVQSLVDTPEDVDRLLPAVQTLMDPGDPATFAPHVLRDRLLNPAAAPPHLLLTMAIGDEIVPNSMNHALARAFDLPVVGNVWLEPGLLPRAESPLAGNLDEGVTAGLFQYNRVTLNQGQKPQAAAHNSVPFCIESNFQTYTFMKGWLDGEVPSIIDPYVSFGTAPL
jgi:dienelactone hydrolase